MSYSESRARLTVFSAHRDNLIEYAEALTEHFTKRGAEYDGPWSRSPATPNLVNQFLRNFVDNPPENAPTDIEIPSWLFHCATTDQHIEQLREAVEADKELFVRGFRVYSDDNINSILNIEPHDTVSLAVTLDKKTYIKGQGYDPATYDPNADHSTDYVYE